MKTKSLIILSLASISLAFTSCSLFNRKTSEDGSDPEVDNRITVNFYVDYNEITAGNVYHTYKIDNNRKLTKPADPSEAPFPEFPIFKGWSHKEIVDSPNDLWDFENDVMEVPTGYKTFNMFGIWVAEGE